MKITISGPVVVTDDATGQPIIDPVRLAMFDGLRSDDQIVNYFGDPGLNDLEMTGGDMLLTFDQESGQLRVVSEFRSSKKLTKKQLA
ncbi:MAG: hypothetical protein ACRC7O_01100, partial [Fimbriiglobus sp.]